MNSLMECDKCNNLINPNNVKVCDKILKPGIQASIWECPHCDKKYLITVMDKAARRMMEANRKDKEKIGNISKVARHQQHIKKLSATKATNNVRRVEELEKAIEERTKKLDERMQNLIKEYKGTI